jgi:MFS family permease
MVAKYGWSSKEQTFYETFIGNTPVLGMIIGRLIGSPLVNKGRFRCIIISSIVMMVGIGFMFVLNIYSFLVGRLIYGLGAGLFFASGPRYIEECSPPQLFSLFYTFYALGIALNRPILLLAALIVPEKLQNAPLEYQEYLKND